MLHLGKKKKKVGIVIKIKLIIIYKTYRQVIEYILLV